MMSQPLPLAASQQPQDLPFHAEVSGDIAAPVEAVFAHIDDHARLATHMSQPSWRMGGGQMQLETDAAHGQSIGSHMRLAGRAFGLILKVEEQVTERQPPWRKYWQTVGSPRLLVIGHYRMGFELTRQGEASRLRVVIDYALPGWHLARWLARPLAQQYARWCVRSMLRDTARAFAGAKQDKSQGATS